MRRLLLLLALLAALLAKLATENAAVEAWSAQDFLASHDPTECSLESWDTSHLPWAGLEWEQEEDDDEDEDDDDSPAHAEPDFAHASGIDEATVRPSCPPPRAVRGRPNARAPPLS